MFPVFNSPPPSAPAMPDSSLYKSCSCSHSSHKGKPMPDQPTSFPQTRGRLDADYAAYLSKGGAIVNCPEPPRAIIATPVVRCPAPERLSRPASPVRQAQREDEQPKAKTCSYPPQAPAKWYDDTVTPTTSRPSSPKKRQCEDSPAMLAKRMCMKKKAASAASTSSSRAASRVTSPVAEVKAEGKEEKPAQAVSTSPKAEVSESKPDIHAASTTTATTASAETTPAKEDAPAPH